MSTLAIHGGLPIRTRPFPRFNTIGEEEKQAVMAVLDSGILSKFLGCWGADFHGGPKVRELESKWATAIGSKHAISVNSNTSGLYAAIGAADIQPGDEVIVPAYTMSASAACILGWGGIPVFADIEPETYCLDPQSVAACISPRTRAILAVDLFGHPFAVEEIMRLAEIHQLIVIEDCAQAPMAMYRGTPAGRLGHIGVFSLNYHKHIHTGEGGVIVTDDNRLADRLRLIRNHGETVVEEMGITECSNIIGRNYRMTEIEAAIGVEQLKKLPGIIRPWQQNAERMSAFFREFPGITPPKVAAGCEHVYYVHACQWDEGVTGVSRNLFIEAMRAELPPTAGREDEGPLLSSGYVKPLYLQPIYQKRVGKCFFNCPRYSGAVSYDKGICPTTEDLYARKLFAHEWMRPQMTLPDLQDIYDAFEKVYALRDQLR